ncbi:MAG: hypothetical protein HY913_23865 [Desulfomonile tiedjei]|nr:hypothetical protein [Desulfomonile tiedjei]
MENQGKSPAATSAYKEVLDLLDRHGLLTERLPYSPALLEEAVFFAYKMRLITQGKVKSYLGLDRAALKEMINEWNKGDEGNCTCRMARNPFADDS